jgi:hypothetical protein
VLEDMLRRVNERDPKVKSLSLPSGRISSQGPKPGREWTTKIADAEAVVAWAEKHFPDLVQTKKDVLVSELRDAVWRADQRGAYALDTRTNELLEVPGVVVERKERTFKAEPSV